MERRRCPKNGNRRSRTAGRAATVYCKEDFHTNF